MNYLYPIKICKYLSLETANQISQDSITMSAENCKHYFRDIR